LALLPLADHAQRIRDFVGVARTCIIEIGRKLIAAKAEVAHGDWFIPEALGLRFVARHMIMPLAFS
jgi:hypothetical protein